MIHLNTKAQSNEEDLEAENKPQIHNRAQHTKKHKISHSPGH